MRATEKQVSYIMYLAGKQGMSTKYMDASWKRLASMTDRRGKVQDFLEGLDKHRASEIINALKD